MIALPRYLRGIFQRDLFLPAPKNNGTENLSDAAWLGVTATIGHGVPARDAARLVDTIKSIATRDLDARTCGRFDLIFSFRPSLAAVWLGLHPVVAPESKQHGG